MSNWVGDVVHFADKQFKRKFRIKWNMVNIIIGHLARYIDFWKKTVCGAGKESISNYVKFLCSQKMICYGVSDSVFIDYFKWERWHVVGAYLG